MACQPSPTLNNCQLAVGYAETRHNKLGCSRISNWRDQRIYGSKGHDHVRYDYGCGANQESVGNPYESGESLNNAKHLRLAAEVRDGEYGSCDPTYGINHLVARSIVEIPKRHAPRASA
jgi:hypothetical protein